jgi:hypothetical protein
MITNNTNWRKTIIVSFNLSIRVLPFSIHCNMIVKRHVSRLIPYYIAPMMREVTLENRTCAQKKIRNKSVQRDKSEIMHGKNTVATKKKRKRVTFQCPPPPG